MEAAELDNQIEELEIRLERLRALYEQYFLGIEKLEPSVARKDVDRRIYVLRREKIRNTGKRFKLQTIIQRYNTFQQYWQRICREIENGTYKRHMLRAERTYGTQDLLTIASRKRLGRTRAAAATAAAAEQAAPTAQAPAPAASDATPAAQAPAPAAGEAPPAAAPPPKSPPPAPVRTRAPAPAAASPAAPSAEADTDAKPAARASTRREKAAEFESLDLDMDFLGDWDPAASKAGKPKAGVGPKRSAEAPPEGPTAKARPAAPAPAPEPKPAPAPSAAAPRAAPPPPPVRPSPAAAVAPPAPRAPLPRVAASGRASLATLKSPAKAEGEPPPGPAGRKPLPRAGATAPAAGASIDEARLRDLHGRLNDLKRQNREAGQVSFEGLAKSLRATEEKLKKQHAGRKIEFDVVVKDGKAVVKPIVR